MTPREHRRGAGRFERDVVTDNVGDVRCHRNLLAEIPVMVLLTKDAGRCTGPNITPPRSGHDLKVRRCWGWEALAIDFASPRRWSSALTRRFEAKIQRVPSHPTPEPTPEHILET